MNVWVTLIISFITDFIITGGGTLAGAISASGSAAMPSRATIVLATLFGAIAASRRIQALLQVSPMAPDPVEPKKKP